MIKAEGRRMREYSLRLIRRLESGRLHGLVSAALKVSLRQQRVN
jgi:hypothetical protein